MALSHWLSPCDNIELIWAQLCSINLLSSKIFFAIRPSPMVDECRNLVEISLSNATNLKRPLGGGFHGSKEPWVKVARGLSSWGKMKAKKRREGDQFEEGMEWLRMGLWAKLKVERGNGHFIMWGHYHLCGKANSTFVYNINIFNEPRKHIHYFWMENWMPCQTEWRKINVWC